MSTRSLLRRSVPLLILAAAAWSATSADEPPAPTARKPWTTSKVVGSPEPPPPYKAVRVFPNVEFKQPLLIARAPGMDRLFVGEREGGLYSFATRPDAKTEPFFDIRKDLKTIALHPGAKGTADLYGLVFHPKFEQNRYCFLCYTLAAKEKKARNLEDGTRVSRFKVTAADPPRIDADSEEIILTWVSGGHNGGDLHFGPDGMLYVSTGDAAPPNPPDPHNTGQDCSDLLSSILRIDVDRPGDPGGVSPRRHYSVPPDNPFVKTPGVRPEIWAYGFRNPWRMSFDRQTGGLWVGDVGWEQWEMVHRIEKGGNYGWSIVEGRQPTKPDQKPGPTPIRPPMIELPHTIAASVTGGYVYRGKKFPELVGAYLFGDWETRRMWAARFDGDRLKELPELIKPNVRFVAFGEDHAGELYFLDYDNGRMFTLERNDAAGKNTDFPKTLSETGLFKSVKDHVPADGVRPFSPNAKQWQDGATAEWFVALPGTSAVSHFEKPRPLPGQVYWHDFKLQFPADAVLVKTISLDVPTAPALARKHVEQETEVRRVETQILHFDGEDWRGYTYAWRDDQTDADLVPADGADRTFTVADEWSRDGRAGLSVLVRTREMTWTYHSRTQCLTCHNSWSEYALAFSPGQLNRSLREDGREYNRLARLNQEGYIRRVSVENKTLPPFDANSVADQPVVPSPDDSTRFNLEQRARGYLHANCAHCHRFGGGGGQVVLELDISKPLNETGILGTRPRQGDFGIPDARLVAPGDPHRSVLFYRMAKFGRGRMPHLGSEWPDPRGLRLVGDWIASMTGPPPEHPRPSYSPDAIAQGLHSVGGALPYARKLWVGLDGPPRKELLKAVGSVQPGPVRDLFEGYLPPDPKGRKLGSSPRPASILRLTGDPMRGEAVFFTKELKCAECHKVGDKGVALGPDLTAIGKTRSRAELLESVLEPSKRIEPQFTPYLVRTADGRTLTGLVVRRDDKGLVLRDAQNKEIMLKADDVEAVQPSRVSLMPDGLVAGLTPQEAADLLEFLASRK